ncbi:MAG: PQQ-dependent catabolism-associated CXXCW motif protein [Gammaproteobacteria bacterium]|nr:PQQ-dependent catabolism-associated CXXCW motif protein [Gammaproteobacteria bacterium]
MTDTRRRFGEAVSLLALAVALWSGWPPGVHASGEDCVAEEPSGYRMSEYRTPVPCTLTGATVVDAEALRQRIERDSPLLVDVLPSPRRPEGLAEGTPWLPPARRNIPGTIWLPNTGFGELPVEEENYLRANLVRLTRGDRSRAIVFYCLADCWMSWNAARRAVAWGYTSVIWFPRGTDEWAAAGLPLEDSSPVPRSEGQ